MFSHFSLKIFPLAVIFCSLFFFTLAGCIVDQPLATPSPLPSDTPLPSPTPTIVWFPPTSTRTPFPTVIVNPTPEMCPGLDEIILEDDFSDHTQWQTVNASIGRIVYGKNDLTIAIAQPKESLLSFRKSPILEDFYLEITANPRLCRPEDRYGIVFRASSGVDFYRLLVNCGGMLALERGKKNNRAFPIQGWTISGEVPIGAPATLRLGLWVVKKEMRVFVNDVFQFAVRDPVWISGSIGLFATSGGDTAVTVSFTNLVVRSIGALPPTPTMTLTPTVTRRPTRTVTPTR